MREAVKKAQRSATVHRTGDAKAALEEVKSGQAARLLQILEEHGWPGKRLVGAQGSEDFCHLILAQRNLLPFVSFVGSFRNAVSVGDVRGQHYAQFVDLLCLQQGRPQLYGTMVRRDQQGKAFIEALEAPETVDQRRHELGLEPLETYLRSQDRAPRPAGAR